MSDLNFHDSIQALLNRFSVDLNYLNSMWYGSCPIHEGDNDSAFKIYEPTHTKCLSGQPFWKCYTRQCHTEFGSNLYGLVKGILSRDGCTPSHFDVVGVLKSLQIGKAPTKTVNYQLLEQYKRLNDIINPPNIIPLCSAEAIKTRLDIPSKYFTVQRGFNKNLVEEYSIGDCLNESKEMFGRAVVPILGEDGNCYGAIGRSLFSKCPLCNLYHDPTKSCPLPSYAKRFGKWYNTSGIQVHNHLLGFYRAGQEVQKTKTIILTEGVGEVLRFNQNGINNVVSVFGAELHDAQIQLITRLGAFNIILAFDKDEAGAVANTKSRSKLKYFNCIDLPEECYKNQKDIGDVPDDQMSDAVSFVRDVSSKYLIYAGSHD